MDFEKILNSLHILDFTRDQPKLKPIHDLLMMELEEIAAEAAKEFADKVKAKAEADAKAAADKAAADAKALEKPKQDVVKEEDAPATGMRRF